MTQVQVELHPTMGSPTGASRDFARVPCRGEVIVTATGTYVVAEVQWLADGTPKVIARQQ
jgi:hypothetical protein